MSNHVCLFNPTLIQDEEMEEDAEENQQAIVLHEDKQYYPSALQVYGEEVRTSLGVAIPRDSCAEIIPK